MEYSVLDTLELGTKECLEPLEALIITHLAQLLLLDKLAPSTPAHVKELAIEASKVHAKTLGSLRCFHVSHHSKAPLALKLKLLLE
jgi:hypothetical protein